MRLDSDRVTAGVRTRPDTENKNCRSELVKSANLPSGSGDVFENGLSLSAVWVPHPAQVRNAEYAHDVAFAYRTAGNVSNALGLGRGHGT
jgi:hypothetical protein